MDDLPAGLRCFKFRNFRQSASMALRTAELGDEKYLHQFPRKTKTDDEATEADEVEVVILYPLMCRKESWIRQARTPVTLLATTEAPTPLPQMATPRSTAPWATARASGTMKSG